MSSESALAKHHGMLSQVEFNCRAYATPNQYLQQRHIRAI
jgi:hypothetical protein